MSQPPPAAKVERPKILRVLAWIAATLLAAGWFCLAAGEAEWAFGDLFAAFVIGLSSCERLGGVSGMFAGLTMIGSLFLYT